jgi:PAS domain S-box-containing protein
LRINAMKNQEQKTILLVEDDLVITMDETHLLKSFGYDVVIAKSGEEAVQIATGNDKIALILMDVNLGVGMDGPEAAKQILGKRNLPIVFLSSHTDKEYVERIKMIAGYGYVVKDSSDIVLQSSIEMAFELFKTQEALRESEIPHRKLMAKLPAGVIIIDPLTRTIKSANARAAAMFGVAAEHIVGRQCHSFLCPAQEKSCPALDLDQEVDDSERVILHADGSRRPVLKSVIRIQLCGQEKLMERFVDIAERKRAEELRKSEALCGTPP